MSRKSPYQLMWEDTKKWLAGKGVRRFVVAGDVVVKQDEVAWTMNVIERTYLEAAHFKAKIKKAKTPMEAEYLKMTSEVTTTSNT